MEGPRCVGAAESLDEVILEGLDGSFGGVDTVVVGLNELPAAVFGLEESFERSGGLVVRDVEDGLVSLVFQFLKDGLKRVDDGGVLDVGDGAGKDVVVVVIIGHKKILISVRRYRW